MKTLIIESSTEKSCVILSDQGVPLRIKSLSGGPELSKRIAMEVNFLIAGEELELIAVGMGPGSYTGIRVGVALAQALAYGRKLPLLGFCSLQAFAPPPVLVDARMGGIYALFDREALLISPDDPRLQATTPFASPHPELIKKRVKEIPSLREKDPDPDRLSALVYQQFLEEGAPPFTLTYLSCP